MYKKIQTGVVLSAKIKLISAEMESMFLYAIQDYYTYLWIIACTLHLVPLPKKTVARNKIPAKKDKLKCVLYSNSVCKPNLMFLDGEKIQQTHIQWYEFICRSFIFRGEILGQWDILCGRAHNWGKLYYLPNGHDQNVLRSASVLNIVRLVIEKSF